MCYSALVKQALKSLKLEYDARIDYGAFQSLFDMRASGEKIALSSALESQFLHPKDDVETHILQSISSFRELARGEIEKELFALRGRLAAAEKKLASKPTKTAKNEHDVAERKMVRLLEKLKTYKGAPTEEDEARIYAFNWTPLIVAGGAERLIVPMRYHLRPFGAPASFDREFPGCYNARLDNLDGFWKRQFGRQHGLMVVSSFFENVKRHDFERRELAPGEKPENIVLQFTPEGGGPMLIPCIWDRWAMPKGQGLGSFALITDEPPVEVAETGHNRCPVFLKSENVDAWLNPQNQTHEQLFALLRDRQTPRYRHQLAA